jgi:thiosulfate/3-mercaptopyruvate sulfurtransferase
MTALTGPLVSTERLAGLLGDPSLRLFDCTVLFEAAPATIKFPSGRPLYDRHHIPGAAFADLREGLNLHDERDNWFTLPAPGDFARAAGALGISDAATVVLYDQGPTMWAARLWWQLRLHGVAAAVLDGGWKKWKAEGRPESAEPTVYPPATLTPRLQPELLATTADVLAVSEGGGACLVNALSREQHRGTSPEDSRRPGHIPSSVNVPFSDVLDPATNAYLPPAALRELFAAQGARPGGRVITYCGGGIAASSAALALTLAGVEDVAVYDGSLREWAADPALPLVVGD